MSMLNTLFAFQVDDSKVPKPEWDYEDKIETARQRQYFFEYIRNLERNGKVALESLLKSGARPGDETAWPMVRGFLDKYLNLANDTIQECTRVDRDYIEAEFRSKTHKRNADSGVSFTSANESFSSADSRAATPSEKSRSPTPDSKPSKSTLERISHQLRKIRSRPDIKETAKTKPALSKKKSLTALVGGRSASSSSSETNFDVDEMKRQKMIWEAKERKKALQAQAEAARATKDGKQTAQVGYAV